MYIINAGNVVAFEFSLNLAGNPFVQLVCIVGFDCAKPSAFVVIANAGGNIILFVITLDGFRITTPLDF